MGVERRALQQQESEVRDLLRDLTSESLKAKSGSTSNVGQRKSDVTQTEDKTKSNSA